MQPHIRYRGQKVLKCSTQEIMHFKVLLYHYSIILAYTSPCTSHPSCVVATLAPGHLQL